MASTVEHRCSRALLWTSRGSRSSHVPNATNSLEGYMIGSDTWRNRRVVGEDLGTRWRSKRPCGSARSVGTRSPVEIPWTATWKTQTLAKRTNIDNIHLWRLRHSSPTVLYLHRWNHTCTHRINFISISVSTLASVTSSNPYEHAF